MRTRRKNRGYGRACAMCGGTGWQDVPLSRLPGLTARRRCRCRIGR
jgi:hypothetical protein